MDLDKLMKRNDGRLSPWDLFIELAKDTPFLGTSIKVQERYALRARLQRIEGFIASLKQRIRDVERAQARFEEKGAVQALYAAMEYVSRTVDEGKIARYAAVIAETAQSKADWFETEAYIHDLYRLRADDLAALERLVNEMPPATEPVKLYEITNNLFRGESSPKAAHDAFASHCARLAGFGLALELSERGPAHGSPYRNYFRPTDRGRELIRLLSNAADGPDGEG